MLVSTIVTVSVCVHSRVLALAVAVAAVELLRVSPRSDLVSRLGECRSLISGVSQRGKCGMSEGRGGGGGVL